MDNKKVITLPKEDVLDKYYVVKDNSGKRTTKGESDLNATDKAALKNSGVYVGGKTDLGDKYNAYVNFSLDNGTVKISGPADQKNSKVVSEVKKLLKDNYTGADLTNKTVAESFQKVLDQVNEQVKVNLQYEEYNKFLKSSGFSDAAYRNYAMAKTDADPNNSTNLLKSKNKYVGYKKNGKLTSKSEAMTAAEWFKYWKENYTPEERIKLWIDSAEALSKGDSDEALYKGLPYILMGQHEDQNAVAGVLNVVNPFDEGKGWEDAKVFAPVNGFDDVDNWSVFWDSFASTNKEALGRFIKWAGKQSSPLERAIGPKYMNIGIKTPEEWGQKNGLSGVTGDMINNISKDDWNEAADIVNNFFYKKNNERLSGKTDAEILEEKYGKEKAARIFLVRDFSTLPTTGDRESGYKRYQQYQDLVKLQETEGYSSPYEKWGTEKEKEMGEHLQRLGTLSPNISSLGAVTGNIARIIGEQFLLGAATGGALTAPNVAKTLTQGGWKLAKNALDMIGIGTGVLSRAPAVAKAVSALAAGSGAGLAGAAKALYVTGAIGTWAIREVGEDALRGLVDDVVTMNSLDSQGNLDPDKFVENVYMNAVMYGLAKLPKAAFGGLSNIVSNAKTRNIDGVGLNATQRSQLSQLQKALDDTNSRIMYQGVDAGNHPVITSRGRTKVLNEITMSGPTAEAVDEAAGVVSPTAARTVEDILENENLSDEIKQKVTDAIDETKITDEATGELKEGWDDEIRAKIRETMTDDEIRQAFPNGMAKIGDEIIKIDTSEFTAADIGRVGGQNFKSMDDAIAALDTASKVNDFANAINGIMRQATNFAQDWKRAVQEFADANDMSVRDVMIAIRDSRIAGEETLPGLRELWENNWKPIQDKLLDVQEKITGVRPESHDFYFRDMIEGTFKPAASGAWAIDQGNATDILGGEAEFDLAASSFARNTGKLGEIASDKLEYDPEVLAREFVASRIQTIWESENGRAFATMQEAFDAGEFDFSEADAIRSVGATETVAREVGDSDGVRVIREEIENVKPLGDEFVDVKIGENGDVELKIDYDSAIKQSEANISTLQNELNSLKTADGGEGSRVKALEDELAGLKTKLREAESAQYARVPEDTPVTEQVKLDILRKTGTDVDELPFRIMDDENAGIISMLNDTPGATREGSLREYNRLAKGLESKVIFVDPSEYLRVLIRDSTSNTDAVTAGRIRVDEGTMGYAKRLENGEKAGTPWLKYDKNGYDGQEGRHRAAAAERAGIEKIPVAVSFPVGKNLEDYGFVEYDDVTDDIAKMVTETARVKKADVDAVKAEISAKESEIAQTKTDIEEKQAALDAEKTNLKELKEAKKSAPKTGTAAVEEAASLSKKQVVDAQKTFNASADKSTSAEQISRNSGYKNRGRRVNAGPVVGVNYMPGNPFGKFSGWVNDQFVKANSIKISWGSPETKLGVQSVTAYNGGYKMYAEAGSFARNVIVDIQNGSNLWDAIYKQIRNNGFFVEPSEYQIKKYGALNGDEQAAKITDKIMDRMAKGNYYYKWSDVFNDDGTVKSTDGLISVLTTRFRGQGINDFTKFIKKADWDTLTKGEQKWLNKRMYEMTASVNKKTFRGIVEGIMKASMGLRYKSNMWFNFKNGQLQLTECQRLFTMNKIGDFGTTLKRLVSDGDYRQKVSDYTYSLAAESVGKGLSKADLDDIADTYAKVGAGSTIAKNGISTDIDIVKAKFGEFNDAALSSIEGGEYAKNYILIAGFVAAGEKQGLEGADLDDYVRNRFNTEALAGTNVGRIGLTDSRIGQFTFMYLGFPIRDLTLFWHNLRGGGIRGDVLGSLEYLAKMIGAKGVIWAAEAPWGYSLMQQLNLDPFGFPEQYSPLNTNFEDRDPVWRWVDMGIEYNPFFQGAMTSAFADIYFSYRAAEEAAREEYKEEHNGSTEGFEWSLGDAGGEMWADLLKGLTPGYTAYSRVEGELSDLDRGYRFSETGNRLYEANTDPLNIGWGLVTGRRNTTNAQDYYQTANPIRGAVTGGLPGLGQQLERSDINVFRDFREFDPVDTDTYKDWFNGSYADQQNWNTGIYYFQEEARDIRDKYDKYAKAGTAINDMNSRENELSDLRRRVEAYVNAYVEKHPEGISQTKQNQLINIFNLGEYQPTLNEAFQESQGNSDYSEWEAAKNRYAQGNFPAAYGMTGPTTTNPDRQYQYARSPQLEQILSENKYGINSEVAPIINQMYNDQKVSTPTGTKTMKEYHDEVYAQLQKEWNKSKPDYKNVTRLQEKYIDALSKNVIEPVLATYGSGVLSAGKSSEIMQEFGKMLYGMVPSDQYRINKKGKTIYQSTPYMTIDIPKWMNANYKSYKGAKKTTDAAASSRLKDIRTDFNKGRTSTAKSKARALIQDIGAGKASLSRDELEWLQGVLK